MIRFAAGALLVLGVLCGLFKHYSIDEYQYAHAAWLVARGAIPYVSFFEFHTPLPYQMGALPFLFLPDDPEAIRVMRVLMVLPLASIVYAGARISAAATSTLAVCLFSSVSFMTLGTEFRPDVWALAYFMLGIAALHGETSARRAALLGGLCVGLSVWASQKALLYGVVFFVALIWKRKLLRDPWFFVLGVASVFSLCGVYLLSTGSTVAWYESCFVWAAYHEREYPGFSAWRYLGPTLLWEAPLFVLAGIGVWKLQGKRFWIAGAMIATLGSFLKARAPFPYALLPFLGITTVAAAIGVSSLKHSKAVLLALALYGGIRLGLATADDNLSQHETLALLGRVTAPTDPVFDSSGQATARPHVGHRFYTSALIRYKEADKLAREVPIELTHSGCVAVLHDLRYNGLPESLRAFIEARFQPLTPDLWLYGQSLDGATIDVPQTGSYFVEPKTAFADITIDGEHLGTDLVQLNSGLHYLTVVPGTKASLLWLPRDGKRWTPTLQRGANFSRLF